MPRPVRGVRGRGVDAAPHMCGFDAARLMMPDIQVGLFVDHAFCQLTGRSRGSAERWLLRACGPRGGLCVLIWDVQKRPHSSKKTRFWANDALVRKGVVFSTCFIF